MNSLVIISFLLLFSPTDINRMAAINKYKKLAQAAEKRGNHLEAIKYYKVLEDSLGFSNQKMMLNLGHNYFNSEQFEEAERSYQAASGGESKKINSIAKQQLGLIKAKNQELEDALAFLKNAIIDDPTNDDARYNYELLKQQKEQQDQQNKDQDSEDKEKKDSDNSEEKKKDNKSGEDKEKEKDQKGQQKNDQSSESKENKKEENSDKGEKKKEKGDKSKEESSEGKEKKDQELSEKGNEADNKKDEEKKDAQKPLPSATNQRLQQINISPEKAKIILEALKNNEVQFYQQMQKKSDKTQDSDKPDW